MGTQKEVFRLDKMLGVGSFGTTYRVTVTDEKLRKKWGETVAIKIPHNKEKEMVLLQELMINNRLSEISCVNLVKYLGFEKFDDKYVMVMEFIHGKSLRDMLGDIGKQTCLEVDKSVEYLKQICRGLIEIHGCHIFHRDIKPDNILIAMPEDIVKISDFGISTAIKSSELASTTAGTIVYMPKEILEGEGGAFYSDIYSLGVTFYEMITGRLPFDGVSYTELINKICNSDPVDPKNINSAVNEKLNAIVMKTMSRDIKKRFQSVEEFLQAVERYEKGSDYDIKDAEELFKQWKIPQAEKKFQELLKADPLNPKVYISFGRILNKCQRYKEAIEIYRKGIEKCKPDAALYLDLSLSLNGAGFKPEALECLKKAIALGLKKDLDDKARGLLLLWTPAN
jgi:serine/threonine-protein kinase